MATVSLGPPQRSLPRRFLASIAGPLLIIVCVLATMRAIAFGGMLTNQHADILSFVLPRFCYLGQRLAAGDIPLWNPWLQAGTPYAADPQSGWLYLPAMTLFSALPCTTAMRTLIVFQPLLGGLGLYWFLRRERLRRTACTVGGIAFSMAIAGSAVGLSMPFAAALAWTPLVLVGVEGYFEATRWSRRLLWMALSAIAWGQVAGAHMSHGLFMCTLIAATYAGAKTWHMWRHRHCSGWVAIARISLFFAFLPLANLAFFLPRLALIPRSALAAGYAALGPTTSAALTASDAPLADGGVWAGWFFALGAAPGAYIGAAVLLCIPAAWRSGHRRLLIGVITAAVVIYLMTLDLFVGAQWFRTLMLRIPYGDIYLHNPSRFRLLFLLLFAILGALGVHGIMVDHPGTRRTLRSIALGAGIFIVVPLVLGASPSRMWILILGAAAITFPLVALANGRSWAKLAVPAILAFELAAAALMGSQFSGETYLGLENRGPWLEAELVTAPGPHRAPTVDAQGYATPGTIAKRMQDLQPDSSARARYMPWAPPASYFIKGYLFKQEPEDWPALFNGRGMLFDLPEAFGYNPFQLERYWRYVRTANDVPIFYNAALLKRPSLSDARLLGVRYLTVPKGVAPPMTATQVTTEGNYVLYKVNGAEPRASVVPQWRVEPSEDAAMIAVTEAGFDPGRVAVLEKDPGLARVDGARPGVADYAEASPEDVRISVSATAPSIVVVRNAWDENWSATVDGTPTQVLPTDGFLQGVAVGPGEHEVRLTYSEPSVFAGLRAAGIVWAIWLLALLVTVVIEERRYHQLHRRVPLTDVVDPEDDDAV